MKTLTPFPGDYISAVAVQAMQMLVDGESEVSFEFNGHTITATTGMSHGDILAEYDRLCAEASRAYNTPERVAEREAKAKLDEEDRQKKFAKLITLVRTADEKALRESVAPWPYTMKELSDYITALNERQHDYGTCVYAMSLSAVAAFNYVGHTLGTTGFQSGCADMDILRRTRILKGSFRLVDYENLLYPQYLNEDHFPSLPTLLYTERVALAKRAKELLANHEDSHPRVRAHWQRLVEDGKAE